MSPAPNTPASPFPNPALRARCTRFLFSHGPRSAKSWVERLASSPRLELHPDEYGSGPALAELEQRCAELLGKEAALFFHKGMVAQQAALLVHAERTRCRTVALHPRSHFAVDEEDALERLAGLVSLRVGSEHRPFTVADLERVHEPLAAVTVELPLRRAGFLATPWDELRALSDWCRTRGVPLHLDGARLWEVQPWMGHSLAEIASLADTVYVSFYKGLGGLGGSVLAGPREVIEATKVWQIRYGGNLYTAFPLVVTALDGMDRHLPRMAAYHTHAVAIARALSGVPGVRVYPEPPHGNSFQVHFAASASELERAALRTAEATGTWLFNRFVEVPASGTCFGELVVGEATLDWRPEEVASALSGLLQRASDDA